jgi:hypothetical protein
MSEPENFLARWSRRKREVADAEKASDSPARPRESRDPDNETGESAALDSPLRGNARTRDSHDVTEPPFDLSTLPSIDSITAETDIRGFFAPGVPAELTRAALRRAWAADPKIRDFVGLEEYAWDFNAPESIPGFGKLEMTDELRREVARIVGHIEPEQEPTPGDHVPSTQPSDTAQEIAGPPASSEPTGQSIAPSSEQMQEQEPQSQAIVAPSKDDDAVQKETRSAENLQPAAKRGHGGALPQ